jgi:hypothetical protein
MAGSVLSPRSGYDHIDLAAAALGADQPLAPIGHSSFGAVLLGHLGRVGLDLVPAILAPHDQPDARAAAALPSVIGEPGVVNASVRAEQEPTKFLLFSIL